MRRASWVACGLLGVGALLTGACGDGGGDGGPSGGASSGGGVAAGGSVNSGGSAAGGKASGGGPASGGAAVGGGVATGGMVTEGGSSPGGEGGMGGEDGMGGTPSGGAPSGGAASTGGVPGAGGAVQRPACETYPSLVTGNLPGFTVTMNGSSTRCGTIPAVHTCDEKPFPQGAAPRITWTAGPGGGATKSYAVVFKDLSVLAVTPASEAAYNRGYHYAIWDIGASVRELPAIMSSGHRPTETNLQSARQWSNFNDYSWFGPCPNFDPAVPSGYLDSYAIVVYALPVDVATVPQPVAGISPVRAMDDYFKTIALATAEFRGTSDAASSVIPDGILPPKALPPCPSTGADPEAGCVE
jgi:phosphatidylethanolamine-binding protein (PEBP) family uncharacterized protein